MTQQVTYDYKKWVLFNDSLKDHKNLYDLYCAIRDCKTVGPSHCEIDDVNALMKYKIRSQSVGDWLTIDEEDRLRLLSYMHDNYFHTNDIDKWFVEKQATVDKAANHNFLQPNSVSDETTKVTVRPHSKETTYFGLKVFFASLGYLAILIFLAVTFIQDIITGVTYILSLVMGVAVVAMLQWTVKGYIVGIIKGNAVKITEKQYPLIYQIVVEQSRQLELKEIPEIYISHGFFNAFVMKFARTKLLMLYSEVVETALNGDEHILRFIIGHELGHIKQKHLTKNKWLSLSNLIPFLGKAYSRGCEYTCDRIGYHFSKKGAVEGILILATGGKIYTKINVDMFVEDSVNSGSFWMWLSEKFSTHPHTSKRLHEIKKYAQYY